MNHNFAINPSFASHFLLAVLIVSIIVGCSSSEEAALVVGDRAFSEKELQLYLSSSGAKNSKSELKKGLVDKLISDEACAQQARKKGLLTDPELSWNIDQAVRHLLAQAYRKSEISVPTDKEVREEYKRQKDRFREPEAKLAAIIYRFQGKDKQRAKDEALSKGQTAYARLKAGEDFYKIARDESEDKPTASKEGILGWVKKRDLNSDLQSAVFNLGQGDFTKPLITDSGVYIFKLLENVRTDIVPYEQVKALLKQENRNERLKQAHKKILEQTIVKRNIKE